MRNLIIGSTIAIAAILTVMQTHAGRNWHGDYGRYSSQQAQQWQADNRHKPATASLSGTSMPSQSGALHARLTTTALWKE